MAESLFQLLHRLFDLRQDPDYGSMVEPVENQCDQAIVYAKEPVQQIRKYQGRLLDRWIGGSVFQGLESRSDTVTSQIRLRQIPNLRLRWVDSEKK